MRQPVEDLALVEVADDEPGAAAVDVRRPHHQPARMGVEDGELELVEVTRLAVEQRGHVLERMVGLEVGGLVGDEGVADRMRAIESVAREERHEVEELLGFARIDPTTRRPGEELLPLQRHLRLVLLPHRRPQDVRFPKGVAGHRRGDLHHVFLVDDHPVGVGEDGLQLREQVLDRLLAALAPHIDVDDPALDRPRHLSLEHPGNQSRSSR